MGEEEGRDLVPGHGGAPEEADLGSPAAAAHGEAKEAREPGGGRGPKRRGWRATVGAMRSGRQIRWGFGIWREGGRRDSAEEGGRRPRGGGWAVAGAGQAAAA